MHCSKHGAEEEQKQDKRKKKKVYDEEDNVDDHNDNYCINDDNDYEGATKMLQKTEDSAFFLFFLN